jgi:hypothetical protein
MPVGKITKSSVEAIKPAAVDQYLLDRELKSFGVNCTPRPPFYLVQYQLHGRRGRIGWSAQPTPIAAYAALALAASAGVCSGRLIRPCGHRRTLTFMAPLGCCGRGRAIPLCPSRSDINLFGYGESVVDLNAEIAHCALNLLVP